MLLSKFDLRLASRAASAKGVTWLERRMLPLLCALILGTAVLYLGYVLMLGSQLAYPVDDAWIHQTFARNLLRFGEFVYNPGEPSSASTSPLWTVLLAGGNYLGIDHRIWSYLLGVLFLGMTGLLVRDLFRTLYPERTAWAALAGLAVVSEPHLGWAALSGMETMLFIFLSLVLLRETLCEHPNLHGWRISPRLSPAITGILGALLVMTRPEGLLLFVLVVAFHVAVKVLPRGGGSGETAHAVYPGTDASFHHSVSEPQSLACHSEPLACHSESLACHSESLACHSEPRRRISSVEERRASESRGRSCWDGQRGDSSPRLRMTDRGPYAGPLDLIPGPVLTLLFFLALLVPYMAFNYRVTGQPFPSTYYAKNVFYAQQASLSGMVGFLLAAGRELFSGPLLALAPGLILAVGALVRRLWRVGARMPLDRMTVLAWLPLLWCAGLVAAYMLRLPAVYHHGRYLMPVIPVLVVYGLWGTLRICELLSMRMLAKAISVLIAVFWAVLWVNGAVVYAWDVKFIDDQNVTVARWLRDNTPPDVLVATHDIGAIGYFGARSILDTAGLITPELAPFVRQPDRILSYLESRRPAYLAIYPSWYPWLARDSRAKEVYRIDQPYAIKQGLDNMVIYRLEWGEEPSHR